MNKLIGTIKNMNMKKTFSGGLILLSLGAASLGLAKNEELEPLTEAGRKIEAHYVKQLDDLRARLTKEIPFDPAPTTEEARDKKFDFPEVEIGKDKKNKDHSLEELFTEEEEPGKEAPTQEEKMAFYMSSDKLDDLLVKFVVLLDATPRGLAEFGQRSKAHFALVERLLSNPELMKRMLIADGAQAKRIRHGYGPARFGEAMEIYEQILKKSSKSKSGILNRLALAIALEHALRSSRPTLLL